MRTRARVQILKKFSLNKHPSNNSTLQCFYGADDILYLKNLLTNKTMPIPKKLSNVQNVYHDGELIYVHSGENVSVFDAKTSVEKLRCAAPTIKFVARMQQYHSRLIVLSEGKLNYYNGSGNGGYLKMASDKWDTFYSWFAKKSNFQAWVEYKQFNTNQIVDLVEANKQIYNIKIINSVLLLKTQNFILYVTISDMCGRFNMTLMNLFIVDHHNIFDDIIDCWYDGARELSFVMTNGKFIRNFGEAFTTECPCINKYARSNGGYMFRDNDSFVLKCIFFSEYCDNIVGNIVGLLGAQLLEMVVYVNNYFLATFSVSDISNLKINYEDTFQAIMYQNKLYTIDKTFYEIIDDFKLRFQPLVRASHRPNLDGTMKIRQHQPVARFFLNYPMKYFSDYKLNFKYVDENGAITSYGTGVTRQVIYKFYKELSDACNNNFALYNTQECHNLGSMLEYFSVEHLEKLPNMHPYFFYRLYMLRNGDRKMGLEILRKFKKDDYVGYRERYLEYKAQPHLLQDLGLGLDNCDDFIEFIIRCDLDHVAENKYHHLALGYSSAVSTTNIISKSMIGYEIQKIIGKKRIAPKIKIMVCPPLLPRFDELTNIVRDIFNSFSNKEKKIIVSNISGSAYKKNFDISFTNGRQVNINVGAHVGARAHVGADKRQTFMHYDIECISSDCDFPQIATDYEPKSFMLGHNDGAPACALILSRCDHKLQSTFNKRQAALILSRYSDTKLLWLFDDTTRIGNIMGELHYELFKINRRAHRAEILLTLRTIGAHANADRRPKILLKDMLRNNQRKIIVSTKIFSTGLSIKVIHNNFDPRILMDYKKLNHFADDLDKMKVSHHASLINMFQIEMFTKIHLTARRGLTRRIIMYRKFIKQRAKRIGASGIKSKPKSNREFNTDANIDDIILESDCRYPYNYDVGTCHSMLRIHSSATKENVKAIFTLLSIEDLNSADE